MKQMVDDYLVSQTMPTNTLVPDPKYHNIRLITPIGRFQYIHVDKPFALTQKDGVTGKLQYSATLYMAAGSEEKPIVADLHKAIVLVANAHWPAIQRPDAKNPSQLISVKGAELLRVEAKLGGLHYPLRSGNDSYQRDPTKFGFLRDMWFLNVSMQPQTKSGQPQRPICLDERGLDKDPTEFYPGCYGRMDITCAPFENGGNRGVTFFLNGVQFARHGERLITSNPGERTKAAFAAAGALPIYDDPFKQPGYGPNTAGTSPPGTVPGFASPSPSVNNGNGGAAAPLDFAPREPIPAGGSWQPAVAAVNMAARPPGT